MNENINFDVFRPSIPRMAPNLAQLALEQADDKHGPTLQQLLSRWASTPGTTPTGAN